MPDFVREKSHVVSPEATRSEEGGKMESAHFLSLWEVCCAFNLSANEGVRSRLAPVPAGLTGEE